MLVLEYSPFYIRAQARSGTCARASIRFHVCVCVSHVLTFSLVRYTRLLVHEYMFVLLLVSMLVLVSVLVIVSVLVTVFV